MFVDSQYLPIVKESRLHVNTQNFKNTWPFNALHKNGCSLLIVALYYTNNMMEYLQRY